MQIYQVFLDNIIIINIHIFFIILPEDIIVGKIVLPDPDIIFITPFFFYFIEK